MGAQLARKAQVFAVDVELTPNEFRLLIHMALTALDMDRPPRYFASREDSAFGLGRRVPDEPDRSDPNYAAIVRERSAAFQRVKEATQGLIKAGAIERIRRGREGQRAEFRVCVELPAKQSRGTSGVPLAGTPNVPLSGTSDVLGGVRQTYPQGTTEEPQGIRAEEKGEPRRAPHLSQAPSKTVTPPITATRREVA